HPQHLDELFAPDPQRAQRLALFVRQRAPRRASARHKAPIAAIDLVGLGQLPDAPSELAHPARIDDYHRQLRRPQTRNQHALVRTTLDQHPLAAGLPKPLGDALDPRDSLASENSSPLSPAATTIAACPLQSPHSLPPSPSSSALLPELSPRLAVQSELACVRLRRPSGLCSGCFGRGRILPSCGLIGPGVVELP